MRRNPSELVQEIYGVLFDGRIYTINQISQEINSNWRTVNDYVEFINYVQSLPPIVIDRTGYNLVRVEKPERSFEEIAREEYPDPEPHQLFLGTLFLKGATDEDRAIMLEITPMMRELERAGRLHITEENKVYLTELGRLTGLGAIKIYSEYF